MSGRVGERTGNRKSHPYWGRGFSGERDSPLGSSTHAQCRRSNLDHGGAFAVGGAAAAAPPGLGGCVRVQVTGAAGPGKQRPEPLATKGGKTRASRPPARTGLRSHDPASTPRLL